MRRLSLQIPGRPMLANDTGHWAPKAKEIKGLRQVVALGTTRGAQLLSGQVSWEGPEDERFFTEPVIVRAWAAMPKTSKRMIDADAIAPAVKAVLDGLVDAHWLPDDGPKYVHEVRYAAPIRHLGWRLFCDIWELDE